MGLRHHPPLGSPEGTVWEGGPVDSCRVTLRISGPDLDPDEITRLLQCDPTFSQKRGERWKIRDRLSDQTAASGRWHYRLTSEACEQESVQGVIRTLFARLPQNPKLWATLSQKWKIDLFCGLFLETENRGFELSSELCRDLAQRGISIGFDIYFGKTRRIT